MCRQGTVLVTFTLTSHRRHCGVLKFEGSEVADLFARYNVHDYIRKHFGDFHTISERLVFDDIDAYIARQGA